MKIAKVRFSDSGKTFDKGQQVILPEERMVKLSHLLDDAPGEKVEKTADTEPEKKEIVVSTEKVKHKKK